MAVRPTIKPARRVAAPPAPPPAKVKMGVSGIRRVAAPPPKPVTTKATMGGHASIRRVKPKSIEDAVRMDRGKTTAKTSMSWLYNLAGSKLKKANLPDRAFKDRAKGNVFIGGMFMYSYDPKWKDELPWYDTLPVVIPIALYNDGWLGLNLHYLQPMLRAKLLDKLAEFRRRAGTDRAYMKISYQFLQGVVQDKLFEPCIHRYLSSHVRSRVARIEDIYWEQVAMLPLQQFQKATAREVWRAGQARHSKRKKKK